MIPSELISMARVIGEDRQLQRWFLSLTDLPQNLRASEIGRLVAEMAAAGEDPKLIAAFRMLADVQVCDAIRQFLRESHGV